jgi:hypothetical protein
MCLTVLVMHQGGCGPIGRLAAVYLLLYTMAACGGGCIPPSYSIGGSVSGLTGTVVLQNNDGNHLPVSASGAFSFSTSVTSGGAYAVTVLTQPPVRRVSLRMTRHRHERYQRRVRHLYDRPHDVLSAESRA